jgi:hypothetical protein
VTEDGLHSVIYINFIPRCSRFDVLHVVQSHAYRQTVGGSARQNPRLVVRFVHCHDGMLGNFHQQIIL